LADRVAGDEIVALMRSAEGPVLSEEPSFALVAGKDLIANTTHLRTLDDMGKWNPTALVRDVEARRFGLIVLNAQRYPLSVLTAIGHTYYISRTLRVGAATYRVFLPGG